MDGFATRQPHEILRQKTLVFIGNNFSGYSFLFEYSPTHPHENNIALAKIVPGWIQRLNAQLACIEYALVPDGFWKRTGKETNIKDRRRRARLGCRGGREIPSKASRKMTRLICQISALPCFVVVSTRGAAE